MWGDTSRAAGHSFCHAAYVHNDLYDDSCCSKWGKLWQPSLKGPWHASPCGHEDEVRTTSQQACIVDVGPLHQARPTKPVPQLWAVSAGICIAYHSTKSRCVLKHQDSCPGIVLPYPRTNYIQQLPVLEPMHDAWFHQISAYLNALMHVAQLYSTGLSNDLVELQTAPSTSTVR